MYRDNTKLEKVVMNCVFNDGGIGDNICRLSAIKYLNTFHPNLYIKLYVPDYFLEFTKHFFNNKDNLVITPFSQKFRYNNSLAAIKTSNDQHTSMSTHLIDHAFNIIVDKQVDIEHKNYLQLDLDKINIDKFKLPERYVIITTGFTAEVREMIPESINGVAQYVISKGYTPVFLGSKKAFNGNKGHDIVGNFKSSIDYNVGLDLRDSTTLLQAGKIIAGAKVIVGLDNGLLHLAACSQIPIVMGMTSVLYKHRAPIRNNEYGWNCYPVVPDSSVKCYGCQSNWAYMYKLDFRNCYYKEQKLDTEIQCIKNLTSDKYIKELEKIL